MARLALGLWLLQSLYLILRYGWGQLVRPGSPPNWTWWVFMAVGFWLLPYVVNIGLTKDWRRKPQVALAAALAATVVANVVIYGTWWAPPLGALVWMWLVYFSAHLGGSFTLSAVLATPGCEMRAIPHLWARITGGATREHYCPGWIDTTDRWERGLHG